MTNININLPINERNQFIKIGRGLGKLKVKEFDDYLSKFHKKDLVHGDKFYKKEFVNNYIRIYQLLYGWFRNRFDDIDFFRLPTAIRFGFDEIVVDKLQDYKKIIFYHGRIDLPYPDKDPVSLAVKVENINLDNLDDKNFFEKTYE